MAQKFLEAFAQALSQCYSSRPTKHHKPKAETRLVCSNRDIPETIRSSADPNEELELEKLSQADTAEVNVTRPLITINSLPFEILVDIFQWVLVLGNQPCILKEEKFSESPNYPDTLLQVCSRWRLITLASPILWTHIDIMMALPDSRRLLRRAKTFLERAGKSPLEVHIIDKPARPKRPCDKSDDERSNLEVYLMGGFGLDCFREEDDVTTVADLEAIEFISTVPTRANIRSIELILNSPDPESSHVTALLHCFQNCASGALAKFTSRGQGYAQFVRPQDLRNPHPILANSLLLLANKLEAAWLPITTLHLWGGICPSWDSTAFRGLTDLRLNGDMSIPEPQFVNILKSSPKLRILKFRLSIVEALPSNAPVTPVALSDLEVLDVIEKRLDGPGFRIATRWIAPGQKPLRLSFWCPLSAKSVADFFRRSSVIELHIRLDKPYEEPDAFERIISLSPGLRMLAVDSCDCPFFSKSASYNGTSTSKPSNRIDALHLQYCNSVQIDKLRQMIKKHSIQILTMWSSTLLEGNHAAQDKDIFALCPVVKRLKRREYVPMEEWVDSIV